MQNPKDDCSQGSDVQYTDEAEQNSPIKEGDLTFASSDVLSRQFKKIFSELKHLAGIASSRDLPVYIDTKAPLDGLERHIYQELVNAAVDGHTNLRDELTGLLARSSFVEKLEHSLISRSGQEGLCALCFIDLDGFKAINDQYGHLTGDHVLAEIGSRIGGSIRLGDLACRWGGDEFVVALQGIKDDSVILKLAQRLLEAISNPLQPDASKPMTLFLASSIGVAIAASDQINPLHLIDRADRAMYIAKRLGKNQIQFAEECD